MDSVYVYLCGLCIISVYGINSILYQRGIYPPESFTRDQKYGLTLLVTTDDALKKYLQEIMEQVKGTLCGEVVVCIPLSIQ